VPATAGHTLYAASKAFVIKFSQSLAFETGHRGVNVTALCPGFTHTEFHDVNGTRALVNQLPKWMWQEADAVAREGYDAVMRGKIVHVTGRVNRVLYVLARIFPDSLVTAVTRREGRRFRNIGGQAGS
jgi:short-subunit dehydrogenase